MDVFYLLPYYVLCVFLKGFVLFYIVKLKAHLSMVNVHQHHHIIIILIILKTPLELFNSW